MAAGGADSIRIPFASPVDQIKATTEAAREAEREVKSLERSILESQKSGGGVSGTQVDALNAQRKQSENLRGQIKELKDAEKGARETLQGFQRGRGVFRYAQGFAGQVGNITDPGNALSVADTLLSSRRTARVAKAVGLGGLQSGLTKAIPYAFAAKEMVDGVNQVLKSKEETRVSNADIQGRYGRGEISEDRYYRMRREGDTNIGRLRGLGIIPGLDTIEQRRALYETNTGMLNNRDFTAKDSQDRAYTQLGIKGYRQQVGVLRDGVIKSVKAEENIKNYNEFLRRSDKEVGLFRQQHGLNQPEEERKIRERIVDEITNSSLTNRFFRDAMHDIEKETKIAREKEEAEHPKKPLNLTQAYERDNDIAVRNATWNEYKRGYVPFNRSE